MSNCSKGVSEAASKPFFIYNTSPCNNPLLAEHIMRPKASQHFCHSQIIHSLSLEELNIDNEGNSISSSGSGFNNWVPFRTPVDCTLLPAAEPSSRRYNSHNFPFCFTA
jgi:hypothetical protein